MSSEHKFIAVMIVCMSFLMGVYVGTSSTSNRVCVVPASYRVVTALDNHGNKYMVPGPCAPHINK